MTIILYDGGWNRNKGGAGYNKGGDMEIKGECANGITSSIIIKDILITSLHLISWRLREIEFAFNFLYSIYLFTMQT